MMRGATCGGLAQAIVEAIKRRRPEWDKGALITKFNE
jgi:hypothetical protein